MHNKGTMALDVHIVQQFVSVFLCEALQSFLKFVAVLHKLLSECSVNRTVDMT